MSVFTAGTDPIIAEFQLVVKAPGSEAKHWVRGRTIREHTHDVRALVFAKDQLVSGGRVDSYCRMRARRAYKLNLWEPEEP